MKPRNPTPHELKLWRESNRFTRKKKDDAELEDEAVADETFEDIISAPAPSRRGLKPAPKAKPQPPALAPLTAREATKKLKTHGAIDATLDLHGLSKLEAYEKVQSFVKRHYKLGHRHLLIITGKGRLGEGILRNELPHWLNEPALRPILSAFTPGKPEKGGNGVTHVIVKKYRE